MTPYETAISRVRALYRIPTAPERNRTLELCVSREPLLLDGVWPGEHRSCCVLGAGDVAAVHTMQRHTDYTKPLPYAENSFDLIVMHRSMDDLLVAARRDRVNFEPHRFLGSLLPILAPGGLVVGCVNNRFSLKLAWARLTRRNAEPMAGYFTLHGFRNLLRASGFDNVQVFTLLPNGIEPRKLVDPHPSISRIMYRRELEANRQHLSFPGYLARRTVAELGLYPHLEEAIFFWGYKPC